MKILFLYQDIDSGAKVATEGIIFSLKKLFPKHSYISYKQNSKRFTDNFAYLKNLCWSIYDYKKIIDQENADIIYTVMFTSALSRIISFKKKARLIFHFHGDQKFGQYEEKMSFLFIPKLVYFELLRRVVILLQSFALQTSHHVIFVSKESALYVFEQYKLHNKIKAFSIIENGVDQNKFHPVSQSSKNKIKRELHITAQVILSYVGRIDEKKGIINLIQAVKLLRLPSICLILAYPKPKDLFSERHLKKIKLITAELGLNKKVLFKENFSELEKIYQISDLTILPSVQEMFPLVMLEALSSGTLFMSTNVGGVSSVLNRISSLLLIEDNNPQTISQRIDQLVNTNPSLRKKLSVKIQKIIKKYTWENTSKEIYKIIQY